MRDHIPDALITAFERQYDSSWNDPQLRKERLAMRYGWAAAMDAKQCLHQIQEPTVNHQLTIEREAFGIPQCPFPCGWKNLHTLLVAEGAFLARSLQEDEPITDHQRATVMRVVNYGLEMARAALAATPAASPVVLPEPDEAFIELMNLVKAYRTICIAYADGKREYSDTVKVYIDIESKLRALLATGGQAQAVAHSVAKTEPVWIAARNLNSIRADYQRETGDTHPGNDYWAGRFAAGYVSLMDAVIDLQLKEPATQQADARDAWPSIESAPKDGTWIQLWRTPEPEESPVNSTPLVIGRWSDEEESFVWPDDQFYDPFTEHGKAKADQMVEAMQTYASNEFTHWAPLSMPSVHRAAIAAAKPHEEPAA